MDFKARKKITCIKLNCSFNNTAPIPPTEDNPMLVNAVRSSLSINVSQTLRNKIISSAYNYLALLLDKSCLHMMQKNKICIGDNGELITESFFKPQGKIS